MSLTETETETLKRAIQLLEENDEQEGNSDDVDAALALLRGMLNGLTDEAMPTLPLGARRLPPPGQIEDYAHRLIFIRDFIEDKEYASAVDESQELIGDILKHSEFNVRIHTESHLIPIHDFMGHLITFKGDSDPQEIVKAKASIDKTIWKLTGKE